MKLDTPLRPCVLQEEFFLVKGGGGGGGWGVGYSEGRRPSGSPCYSFNFPSQSISSLYSISARVFCTLVSFSSMSAIRF
jgi:hypothetical protein